MIPDWNTNTVVVTHQLCRRFPRLANGLAEILNRTDTELHVLKGARDLWIRDFAPVQVTRDSFVQFRYFPDYLRQGFKHLITSPKTCAKLSLYRGTVTSLLTLDGGNVVGTSKTAILTEKVFSENADQDRETIGRQLAHWLRVSQVITVPVESGDEIGHSDGMVRFLDDTTVVVNDYRPLAPAFANTVESRMKQAGLKLVRLPYVPDLRPTKSGKIPSAVGNYVNFLRVGTLVILPTFGLAEDRVVESRFRKWLPDCQVETLPCRELAQEGGILNCATATLRRVKRTGRGR